MAWGSAALNGARDKAASGARGRPETTVLRLLALPLAVTLLALGWQAWHAFSSYHASREIIVHYVETENIRALIEALEARKQMSIHLDAATERRDWATHYSDSVAALGAALDEAIATAIDHPVAVELLERVRARHQAVSEWEGLAVRSIAAGDIDGAATLLSVDRYADELAAFTGDVDRAIRSIGEDAHGMMLGEQRSELVSFAISVALVVFAVFIWIALLSRLLHSRARLSQETDQRIEAERRLRQAQKMEAVARLAGGVAHDFKNILLAIGGNLNAAMRYLGRDHPATAPLASLKIATNHADLVVRGLLTYGRRPPAEYSAIEARTVITDALTLLRSLLPASIDVRYEPDPQNWHINGDKTQLEQVIINLVLNARNAMPLGGRLTIRTSGRIVANAAVPQQRVCIEITDTGIGMAPDILDRAFEPFFTTRQDERGTGLGLTVAQGIVADHGGTIELVSRPGEGTTAIVSLPATASTISEKESTRASDRLNADAVVVVAGKKAFSRELTAETLQEIGFKVASANSVEGVLTAITGDPDRVRLLVIDVDIVTGDCLATIHRFRQAGKALSIILVAGADGREIARDLGNAAIVLCKPFPMAELARLSRQMVTPATHIALPR